MEGEEREAAVIDEVVVERGRSWPWAVSYTSLKGRWSPGHVYRFTSSHCLLVL